MKSLLRFFFHLLYHQFAFTYDLVAATVSFNRWKDWVLSVVPFIDGPRVLEIGHGPGHLQGVLLTHRGGSARAPEMLVMGIDQSPQMGRLARRNLIKRLSPGSPTQLRSLPGSAYTQINLTRGAAQHLPFPSEFFDTIVATFPTEYISDPGTLAEIRRCLSKTGRLIVLPVALPRNPFLDRLFRITHQRPTEALEVIRDKLKEPFAAANFETEVKTLEIKSGILLIVLATK